MRAVYGHSSENLCPTLIYRKIQELIKQKAFTCLVRNTFLVGRSEKKAETLESF